MIGKYAQFICTTTTTAKIYDMKLVNTHTFSYCWNCVLVSRLSSSSCVDVSACALVIVTPFKRQTFIDFQMKILIKNALFFPPVASIANTYYSVYHTQFESNFLESGYNSFNGSIKCKTYYEHVFSLSLLEMSNIHFSREFVYYWYWNFSIGKWVTAPVTPVT